MAELEDELVAGILGCNGQGRLLGVRREYLIVRPCEDRHLHGTALAPQIPQLTDDVGRTAPGDLLSHPANHGEILAHLHIQRAAAQFQCRFQPLLDVQAEPAVDAPIDELQREGIDDQQRDYRQHHQQRHHAHLQTRARNMVAIVENQLD